MVNENKKLKMENQLFYGSICLSDLLDLAKQKHSAFTKGQNGKIYANINVWLNAEKDKFGNIMSIQLNPTKERKDLDKRPYVGNCKPSEGPKPIQDKDTRELDLEGVDIPTGSAKNAANPDDNTDLPF